MKKELPKKMYSKFPDILKEKLSEEKWLTLWNGVILLGPLEEVRETVTKALEPYVWGWVAKTYGYIAEGIVYAII
ncbi:hypothetical protein [Brevibacillus sp. SKDU10]|uniref:hypothetical protein n=1 Tax=Brevibacillus sp. SKDU10 TaxID=1247872 RepID=UPI000B31F3D9|nr:hypothetical protein [Brevibacillus sp. SKDU10]